jgi:hypothetical protein
MYGVDDEAFVRSDPGLRGCDSGVALWGVP